jgi:esterase/lipase superfamily enzyme
MMHDVRIVESYETNVVMNEMVNQMIIQNKHSRVANQIQILDRLLEHNAIDQDTYVDELKRLSTL